MNQGRQLAWIHLNLDRNALPCRFNGIPRPLTTSVLFEPRPRPASFFVSARTRRKIHGLHHGQRSPCGLGMLNNMTPQTELGLRLNAARNDTAGLVL